MVISACDEHVHVLVNRVRNISCPHRLDRADTAVRADVATEPAAGDDLAETIDVGAERQRRRQLEVLVLEHEREPVECGRVVRRELGITGGMGVDGSDAMRVSNRGCASGSERRVIQNANGAGS